MNKNQMKWYHEEYSKSPKLQDFAIKIATYWNMGLRETLSIVEPRWQQRLMEQKYD